MIPRLKPYFDIHDWLAIFKFQENSVQQFEAFFAKQFGCHYGTMFSYGRSALYVLIQILALRDVEIICPAYTCVVVAHAIVLSGNIPVFVDCEENSFNMSLSGLEQAITSKTRLVVLTHLFGYPMQVQKAEEIIKAAEEKYQHKIYIINDTAHSFGAESEGLLVTAHGDAAIFGLNISKLMSSIFGGMIITNDQNLKNKLTLYQEKHLKHDTLKNLKRFLYFFCINIAFNSKFYNFINKIEKWGWLDYFVKYYQDDVIDFPKDWNVSPSSIEAKIGQEQLKKYPQIIEIRRENAKKIIDSLASLKGIDCLPFQRGATYSHLVALVENRNFWLSKFIKHGIQIGTLIDYSIPYLTAYKKYMRAEYPVSKKYSQMIINFPIWGSKLSDKIINVLKSE